jgi:pimeloyl-ACP methyl ester carboxylesterase
MVPHYFGECFGWFHYAKGGRGIVLCSAFGVEDLVTHRFVRRLACEIAAAGMPALRFDYHGTGNSPGDDSDPGRVDAWLASIRTAVEWMRREAGVQEVVLVGFRLGALLAVRAAEQLADICGLVLVGPVVSGKTYVRELKALANLAASPPQAGTAAAAPVRGADGIEVTGFTLTADTMASLQRIDLLGSRIKPAPRVLILGRDNVAGDGRLAEHLCRLGCSVDHDILPGYAEMTWNSSIAELPDHAFAGLVQWLKRDLPPETATSPRQYVQTLRTGEWAEEAVRFGPEERLFGIRCTPKHPWRDEIILFVNHGADRHIGWARMYVAFARAFAAAGLASFRMDASGLGDSPACSGQRENRLYRTEAAADVSAAIDWLQRQGYRKFTVIGHCAGAHLAFYSALQDPRIHRLIMVNLQRFFWKEGDSLEVAFRKRYRSTGWYLAMLRDPDVWRRLLRGEVDVRGISAKLLRQLVKRSQILFGHGLARVSGTESNSQKVVRWFRELSQRGTRVLLIYSAEDVGLDELTLHCGTKARKITSQPGIELRILDGADHNITPRWARERYAGMLSDYLTTA